MKTYTELEQELHETQQQMLAMRQPGVKTQIRRDNTGIDTSDNQTQQKG
jgi:hypothetical protein